MHIIIITHIGIHINNFETIEIINILHNFIVLYSIKLNKYIKINKIISEVALYHDWRI